MFQIFQNFQIFQIRCEPFFSLMDALPYVVVLKYQVVVPS